jgi:hypothetical protein
MSGWMKGSQTARGLFALVALCAVFVRVAIPTGFMPTQGVGGIVISLCTGQGAAKALLPVELNDPGSQDHAKDGDCAFATGLGSGLVDALRPVLLATPVIFDRLLTSIAIADLTVHRLAAPPPPAQGPPLRA